MAVDLTVSNLLRASPTRSSKQLESFFQLQVCLFLPFPALLPLSRFNAANIVFPHLQTSIALVCRVISLGRFWSSLQRTCVVIDYFVGDQPMRKCVAHTVVGSRKIVLGCWVGCLRPGLFYTEGRGGVYSSLWVTGRLICTTALSFWVKLLALQFPHSHMCTAQQETWTDLHHLCVAETVLAVPCCRLMSCFLWLTFLGTVVFWFSKLHQFKLREK